MKHDIPQNVIQVFKELGLDPKKDGWNCHGSYVLHHKTLEKIAASKGVTFDAPVIVESNAQERICVLCVTGRLGDKVEWSIGEAMPINIDRGKNQQSYPYAMAEKRAKDRVIIKLVGLYGAYSQDEADWDAIKEEKDKELAEKKKEEPKIDVSVHPLEPEEPEQELPGQIPVWQPYWHNGDLCGDALHTPEDYSETLVALFRKYQLQNKSQKIMDQLWKANFNLIDQLGEENMALVDQKFKANKRVSKK
jgi:hypothetical protein